MKLLLTSGGITNAGIRTSLVHLLGKPISESTALLIPTGIYAHPMAGLFTAWDAIRGQYDGSLTGMGWKAVGVLGLTALTGIKQELWLPILQNIDALLVEGGDALSFATGCARPESQISCLRCALSTWVLAEEVWS